MARGEKIMKICMFCSGKVDLVEDATFLGEWAVEVSAICPVCHNDFRMIMQRNKWERIKAGA